MNETKKAARARWRSDYREARKVRRLLDTFKDRLPEGWLGLCRDCYYPAFVAAARVEGEPCSGGDPLRYWVLTRLLWKRSGCRMAVA